MADSNKIKCPNCGFKYEISEALSRELKKEYEVEMQTLRNKMEKQASAIELEREQFEKSKDDLKKKELEIKKQYQEQLATEVEAHEIELKKKIADESRKKAEEKFALEKEEMTKELAEKESELNAIKKQELELRKRERELESKQNEFDLRVERELSEQRKKILEEAEQNFSEKQKFKMIEKEELIKSLRDQISELQRRSEVGSQEAQGEALEKDLFASLKIAFPYDEFTEVKKGERGHDITQTVKNEMNKVVGTIIWEAKNTKAFNQNWIEKLKIDLQRENAEYAILVTLAMPKEIEHFDQIDNIWISDYKSAFSLCAVLRNALAQIFQVRAKEGYRESLKDKVYDYITGVEFKRHLNRIHDAFNKMQEDLEKEKKAMQRHWKVRQKSIESIITSVVNIDGDITGYLVLESGQPLLEGLGLEDLADNDDSFDDE